MTSGGKVRTIGAACSLVLLLGFGGWFVWQAQHPAEERFCLVGVVIVTIDGHDVILQDNAPPGRDGCDGKATERGTRVLGRDCKVREPDGDVLVELVPNRSDGTCGLPGSGETTPDPWPHR